MATISMDTDSIIFTHNELPIFGYPVMEAIRREGKLCDVTLKVGEQKFTAHRIVLAATIPYFHAMFTHDMMESKQDKILMQGIDASVLEELVNYAYSGKVEISLHNVMSLLEGANFLQLQIVKDACCNFMKKRLNAHNCLGIISFADRVMCGGLYEAAMSFLNKNFVEISRTAEEFLALSESEILMITASDHLNVKSEEQVFEAVTSWVRCDQEARKHLMPQLLARVRLPLIRPQILKDKILSEELVKTCHQCRDLVDEAKDYHLLPENRAQLQSFRTRPRCCNDVVGLVYAVGGLTKAGESLSTVEVYDVVCDVWKPLKAMNSLRSRVGVAVLSRQLFAMGGYDGHSRLATVEVFDPEGEEWFHVPPMNSKRSALGAVAVDGKVFACGGYDGFSSLNSVEMYDPEINKWVMVCSMNNARSAAGVTVFNGQVCVIGGHDGLSIFDSVECYDQYVGQWRALPPMLSKRCRLGTASLNGKLYVCGGYDGSVFLDSVEEFDPLTNSWRLAASMNSRRSRVAVVANCGRLYAIGGYDGVTNLNTVEAYDPIADTWTFVSPMSIHEGGVGVGVIPFDM